MRKETYETPLFESIRVEMEEGIMLKASVFEPEDGHDKGVSIEGHGFGNSGNYFDGQAPEGSGVTNEEWNSWDN